MSQKNAAGQKFSVGGQAVMEGVMMQGPRKMAVAVRRNDGKIVYKVKSAKRPGDKYPFLKWPVIRGVVSFVMSLYMGMGTLTESAEMGGELSEEPSAFEKKLAGFFHAKPEDMTMALAVVLALVLAVGMFFVLPTLIEAAVRRVVENRVLINLLGGLTRIAIFLGYVIAVSQIKEIKRVFRYHGAEHKAVYCYEKDKELTVDNAQSFTTLHPRCGTSFLVIVMVISIAIFVVLGSNSANVFARVLSRLALLPLVAGVSYEILRFLGKAEDGKVVSALKWPGMMVQKITTAEPDNGMVEVALVALKAALEMPVPEGAIDVDAPPKAAVSAQAEEAALEVASADAHEGV